MDRRTLILVILNVSALFVCSVLSLVLIIWMPKTVYAKLPAHMKGTALTSVQVTPVPTDQSITSLTRDKLIQEIDQLKHENDRSLSEWLWNNASVLVIIGSALFGLYRWIRDRRVDRDKRSEEQFHSVVESLGGERVETKVGGAIVLRTFLLPGYEKFYRQVFDLAIANLRLQQHTPSDVSELPNSVSQTHTTFLTVTNVRAQMHPNQPTSELANPLSQALALVFKESYPLARNLLKRPNFLSLQGILIRLRLKRAAFKSYLLDATGIQLDGAHLERADLKEIWMPEANLEQADLTSAELNYAKLAGANLTKADLKFGDLTHANLIGGNLTEAILKRVELKEASLDDADLTGADLCDANLTKAILRGKVILTRADLTRVDLTGADLSGANLLEAKSLEGTKIHNVFGLNDVQLEACRQRGASVQGTSQV